VAIVVTFAVTIAVTLGSAWAITGHRFRDGRDGPVILLAAIYIVVNAACIGFLRPPPAGLEPAAAPIIPLLGIAAFVPAWLNLGRIRRPSIRR